MGDSRQEIASEPTVAVGGGIATDDITRHASRFLGVVLANQYRIDAVIGGGAMGVVYRAHQVPIDRDVAVKVLRRELVDNDVSHHRFENEAKIIGRLRHPNTLRLFDCQRLETGELFIVTELLTGRPLSRVLETRGAIPFERSIRILDQVCGSLAEAHAAGIVHRDLKPENLFLDQIGDEDVVKVLDFGIAKILEGNPRITQAGVVAGTPLYMSPEQAKGIDVDHRSDIYTLGVILFEMLTGRPPFVADSVVEILHQHIAQPTPPLSRVGATWNIPLRLEGLVSRMLEKAPERRPQSVTEVRREIAAILGPMSSGGMLIEREPELRSESLPEDGFREVDVSALMNSAVLTSDLRRKISESGGRSASLEEALRDETFVPPDFARPAHQRRGPSTPPASPRANPAPSLSSTVAALSTGVFSANDALPRRKPGTLVVAAAGLAAALAVASYAAVNLIRPAVPFLEEPSGGDVVSILPVSPRGRAKTSLEGVARDREETSAPSAEGAAQVASAVGVSAPPAIAAAPATVRFDSAPTRALVIAPDGAMLGKTPLEIVLPQKGEYQIVSPNGGKYRLSLDPEKDRGRLVSVVLAPSPASDAGPRHASRSSGGRGKGARQALQSTAREKASAREKESSKSKSPLPLGRKPIPTDFD